MAQRPGTPLMPQTASKKKVLLQQSSKKLGYVFAKRPARKAFSIYKPKGCRECMEIGYRGRTGIYELLVMDNELRDCVLKNPSLDEFREMAHQKGMKTLRESALQKALGRSFLNRRGFKSNLNAGL